MDLGGNNRKRVISESSSDGKSELVGSHEDWDAMWTSESSPSQSVPLKSTPSSYKLTENWVLKNMQRELHKANQHIEHMEWHCTVSRLALRDLPGGLAALEATRNKLHNDGEFCTQCELEELQAKVKHLERELQAYKARFPENK